MSPAILGWGMLLFSLCMVVHAVLWRIFLSRVSSLILVLIFVVVPCTLAAGALLLGGPRTGVPAMGPLQVAEVLLLHLSLSGVYIASYPAVRAVSPSLELLLIIKAAGTAGLTEEEIERHYVSRTLVNARVNDLIIYGFLRQSGEEVRLAFLGRVTARFFLGYRRFLGLPVGEG